MRRDLGGRSHNAVNIHPLHNMSSPAKPRISTLTIACWFRHVVGTVKVVLRGKHKKLIPARLLRSGGLSLLLICLVMAGVFGAGQWVFVKTPRLDNEAS